MTGTRSTVVVVGAGLAGLCAALAAHEVGAHVVVLEAAPREYRGGNSRFSNGSFRVAHDGANLAGRRDLGALVDHSASALAERVRVQPYPEEQFARDILTMSRGRSDRDELALVVGASFDAARWLATYGVRWEFNVKFSSVGELQAADPLELDPGASLAAVGSGPGLMEALFAAVEVAGIEVRYETSLDDFVVTDGAVEGVRVLSGGRSETVTGTVVLASGGFEANPEMRRKYLGEGWDLVAIRGSRYNTGRGLVQALALGALPGGHWGGCHSVPTDAQIPLLGDLDLSPCSERYSYADGILVNERGLRFVDEGEDLFTMTYTKVGAAICAQPGSVAYQLFDARFSGNLQQHYYSHGVPVTAETITELAHKLGIPARDLEATISVFNDACPEPVGDQTFSSEAVPAGQPVKSHWALPLDRGPFAAYKVTSGISFTYGGITTTPHMQARGLGDHAIKGLYAAGGVVGGLFYYDYPAAAALTRAAVCGRLAGRNAARATAPAVAITPATTAAPATAPAPAATAHRTTAAPG